MATKFNSHVLRGCNRLTAVTRIPRRTFFSRTSPFRNIRTPVLYFCLPAPRNFQTTSSYHAGIMPETDKPAPREAQDNEPVLRPAEQTEEEFHQRSEDFLQNLVERLEQLQDKNSALEVEYSAGVLSIDLVQSGEKRSYVLNKQPPNKQIWLSSPVSGPKRYDWVVVGEGQHQKEGAGLGEWVYIRDGTSLSELLRKEIGVNVESEGDESV